ncbi:glycosyltransferase family 4 protein [Candidatus Pantoea formicae]|uniref:glycosyltransferase family 4 protein n=1 Tax=Candidatus Pantoea formicae TaxID=2608355 RepID=UPI003EDAC491
MKVIHLINLEKMGGAEKVFLQYISNSVCDNVIFCISNSVDESIIKSLNDHKVTFVNRLFSYSEVKFPPFLRPLALHSRIKRESADVLIVWDLVPRLKRKVNNIKTIYYDHGSSWVFPDNKRTRHFFDFIDAAIAPSQASKAMMQQRHSLKAPIEVIPNTLSMMNKIIEPKSHPTKDEVVLGTASRLAGVKGISISILLVAELLARGINAKLLIAGKGPDETALKNLVKVKKLESHIYFLGYCENLDFFYHNIHIYMSTSFAESFGLSCLAAQHHGVPCIYSVVDGQPEVNIDGVTGIGIIPSLPLQEYIEQIGYFSDIERQYVYDPISKSISHPKAVSFKHCADIIEKILNEGNYDKFLDGIRNKNISYHNQKPMTSAIDHFLTRVVAQ